MLTPHKPPPEDYYQNNCRTLFGFVLRRFGDVLDASHRGALRAYLDLADDPQRLFARLLTRKGPVIRVDRLRYAEIGDLRAALEALQASGLIHLNAAVPVDRLLNLMVKPELCRLPGVRRSASALKPELVHALLSGRNEAQLLWMIGARLDWLTIACPEIWEQAKLLYFGDAVQDWSAFVLRDLGMVDYEAVPLGARRPADPDAFQEELRYQRYSTLSHRLDEHPDLAETLCTLLLPLPTDRWLARRRNRALMRIAGWQERHQSPARAVATYDLIPAHPARERGVRLMARCGRTADAGQRLAQIRDNAWCEEERQFAERFGQRNRGFQPPVLTMEFDGLAPAGIEQRALELLGAQAGMAWGAHVENTLVRTLTGLLYWDVIFADVPGAFTNPFQTGPNDLFLDDFSSVRQQQIEALERTITCDRALRAQLTLRMRDKWGKANALVSWQLLDSIDLEDVLTAIPIDHIRRLTAFLVRNLSDRRAGFPDLLVVYRQGGYEWLEVKGPNDQLQPGQRVWFKYLARLGIPARVLRLKAVP